ncbi:hypothetical protein CHU98_g10307 [Xylaria longipes]|nr:hypothetical protein CHU98_g10307 [Xylaria longipes]
MCVYDDADDDDKAEDDKQQKSGGSYVAGTYLLTYTPLLGTIDQLITHHRITRAQKHTHTHTHTHAPQSMGWNGDAAVNMFLDAVVVYVDGQIGRGVPSGIEVVVAGSGRYCRSRWRPQQPPRATGSVPGGPGMRHGKHPRSTAFRGTCRPCTGTYIPYLPSFAGKSRRHTERITNAPYPTVDSLVDRHRGRVIDSRRFVASQPVALQPLHLPSSPDPTPSTPSQPGNAQIGSEIQPNYYPAQPGTHACRRPCSTLHAPCSTPAAHQRTNDSERQRTTAPAPNIHGCATRLDMATHGNPSRRNIPVVCAVPLADWPRRICWPRQGGVAYPQPSITSVQIDYTLDQLLYSWPAASSADY